jgi:hypothetical protein
VQTRITKWKQLEMTLTKMHWIIRRKSKLSTSNNILIYKAILKPIRTYAIQLCGTASTSNTEIVEGFQSKVLHMILDALWYVRNAVIRRELQTAIQCAPHCMPKRPSSESYGPTQQQAIAKTHAK